MMIDHYFHGCATFKNNGKEYAVVAGGYSIDIGGMPHVEFLDLSDENGQWISGELKLIKHNFGKFSSFFLNA